MKAHTKGKWSSNKVAFQTNIIGTEVSVECNITPHSMKNLMAIHSLLKLIDYFTVQFSLIHFYISL